MYEGASPNPSTKNFLNMPVSDAELEQSGQPTHILKVLGESGGRGVFQNASSPGNLIRLKAHWYYMPTDTRLDKPAAIHTQWALS